LILVGVRKDLIQSYNKLIIDQFKESLLPRDSLFKKYPLTTIECFIGKPINELQKEYNYIMNEYKEICEQVKSERAYKWKKNIWDKLTLEIIHDYKFMNKVKYEEGFSEKVIESEIDDAMIEHEKILKELNYVSNVKEINDFENKTSSDGPAVINRMKMIPPDENCEFVKDTFWNVQGRGMSLIYRRIHPLKPSYTVVAFGGGGTWGYHYERNRATLTNRERARLQTFPDKFKFKGNRSEVRAQIGEAVPPLVGKRIANALKIFDFF
jgi:DNA (cytosine-5)-methyltransferase 1